MTVDLSIVIVSFNAREHLDRCLRALHDAPAVHSHEIIVVDNASSDGSADVGRRWPNVQVIVASENLGFARGTNVGVRSSGGTNLLFLNSDTVVSGGAIDQLLGELDRHRDVAVVGPRLVDGQGRAELSFGRMVGPLNEFRRRRLMRGYHAGQPDIVAQVDRETRLEHFPDWVSGACLLVRREDAEAVGLLDERYFMYLEDVDFCAAIRARGRRVMFAPTAEVVHLRGQSVRAAADSTRRAYRRSQVAFYAKHHPAWLPMLRLYLRLRGADT